MLVASQKTKRKNIESRVYYVVFTNEYSNERMQLVAGEKKEIKLSEEDKMINELLADEGLNIDQPAVKKAVESETKVDEISWEDKRNTALKKTKNKKVAADIVSKIDTGEVIVPKPESSSVRTSTSPVINTESPKVKERSKLRGKIKLIRKKEEAKSLYKGVKYISLLILSMFLAYTALEIPDKFGMSDIRLANTILETVGYNHQPELPDTVTEEVEIDFKVKKQAKTVYELKTEGFSFEKLLFQSKDSNYLPLSVIVIVYEIILLITFKVLYHEYNPRFFQSPVEDRGMMLKAAAGFLGSKLELLLAFQEFFTMILFDICLVLMLFILSVSSLALIAQNQILYGRA